MSDATATRYLLPPDAYTSTEWFEAEREQLFERVWMFAGVEHDLTQPGDYVALQVGRAPVVVVRDGDGELRAFHNLCRHRGVPLVDGQGNCGRALLCPYHRWNYGLDGSLRSVPQKEQYPDLDLEALSLFPVRCETWKTLVFVTLEDEAESLESWLGGLGALFENFHPEELVEISHEVHDVASNWKLYVENHVDWLHLWYLHDQTLGHYDHAAGERIELGRNWASFEGYVDAAGAGAGAGAVEGETGATDGALLPIPGLSPRESSNGAHFLFPSLTVFTNDGYWMLGQVIPIDPDHFQLHLRVFGVEGGNGPAFQEVLNLVMFEDYGVTEAIQRGLRSPRFEVGPLATAYEREIMRMHQHYLDHVTPPG